MVEKFHGLKSYVSFPVKLSQLSLSTNFKFICLLHHRLQIGINFSGHHSEVFACVVCTELVWRALRQIVMFEDSIFIKRSGHQ